MNLKRAVARLEQATRFTRLSEAERARRADDERFREVLSADPDALCMAQELAERWSGFTGLLSPLSSVPTAELESRLAARLQRASR